MIGPQLGYIVLALATASPASKEAQVVRYESPTLLRVHIPRTWTKQQKTKYALPAGRLVAAARVGKNIDVSNAVIMGRFNLRSENVTGEVLIRGSTIQGDVDCSNAHFGKLVAFDGTTFVGTARFVSIRVDSDALFRGAVFKAEASFDRARIGSSAFFDQAAFHGLAHFHSAQMGSQALFDKAVFEKQAIFDGMEVRDGAGFQNARFEQKDSETTSYSQEPCQGKPANASPVTFLGARLGGGASFRHSFFAGSVAFDQIRVDGTADFFGARFEGQARFTHAVFAEANFRHSFFRGDAFFDCMRAQGGVYFGATDTEKPAIFKGCAKFWGAVIGAQADFEGVEFGEWASWEHARIDGSCRFAGATFKGGVNLAWSDLRGFVDLHAHEFGPVLFAMHARIGNLYLAAPGEQPILPETVDLRDCNYHTLEPLSAWKGLLQRQKPYDRRPYSYLEGILRAAGDETTADDVYYERNLREFVLSQQRAGGAFTSATGIRKIGAAADLASGLMVDRLWRWLTGYGVRTRILWDWYLGTVLLGTLVFAVPGALVPVDEQRPEAERMPTARSRTRRREATRAWWRRFYLALPKSFWFTLDAFLPIGLPRVTQVRASPRLVGFAAFIRIAGWVLVPIGILSLTGLLNR